MVMGGLPSAFRTGKPYSSLSSLDDALSQSLNSGPDASAIYLRVIFFLFLRDGADDFFFISCSRVGLSLPLTSSPASSRARRASRSALLFACRTNIFSVTFSSSVDLLGDLFVQLAERLPPSAVAARVAAQAPRVRTRTVVPTPSRWPASPLHR